MTINKKVYKQFPDLIKLYRFEGANSVHYFNFNEFSGCDPSLNYIYFSSTMRHHQYYCKKRIQQYINGEILSDDVGIKLTYKTLLNLDTFREIIKYVENYAIEDKLISIEFDTSQTFGKLLDSNYINNKIKKKNDRRIEIVDTCKHSGGFGFCGCWLELFNIFTYFYSTQRITKENILDFLYAYRKAVTCDLKINPMEMLTEEKNRVIRVNEKLFHSFTKYELMNVLESIIEQELYFYDSILGSNPQQQIKDIIKEYCDEREMIVDAFESEYQKRLKNIL